MQLICSLNSWHTDLLSFLFSSMLPWILYLILICAEVLPKAIFTFKKHIRKITYLKPKYFSSIISQGVSFVTNNYVYDSAPRTDNNHAPMLELLIIISINFFTNKLIQSQNLVRLNGDHRHKCPDKLRLFVFCTVNSLNFRFCKATFQVENLTR